MSARRSWALVPLVLFCTLCGAQERQPPAIVVRDEMLADLDQLERHLQRSWGVSRDLRYSASRIDRVFAIARRTTPEWSARHEFVRVLRRLVAGLDDGHAGVFPGYPARQFRLPIDFVDTGTALLVRGDPSPFCVGVAVGDRLVAIDGLDVDDALRRGVTCAPESTARSRRSEALRAFRRPSRSASRLWLVDRHGRTRTTQVLNTPLEDPTFEPEWTRLGDGGTLLRVPSFMGLERSRDELFERIEVDLRRALSDARFLIVDLRGNSGGREWHVMSVAAPLLPSGPNPVLATQLVRDSPEAIDEVPRIWRGSDLGEGWWLRSIRREERGDRPIFSGPVAVLVDGETACAAELFAHILREHRPNTMLVGEPTRGSVAITSATLTLEHSRVDVWWSIGHIADCDGRALEGVGLVPDLTVQWSLDALLAGQDPHVDAAVRAMLAALQRGASSD